MADITASVVSWSTTESSNQPADSTTIGAGLDDNLRAIQAGIAKEYAKGSDLPSASSVDIGASGTSGFVDVTGTTTITSFGTARAGIRRAVRFTGALTLTHNATSMILPGGASITTAANDVADMISLGSGNWICAGYSQASTFTWSSNAIIGGSSLVWDERLSARRTTDAVVIGGYSSSASYTSSVLRLQTETAAGSGWLLIDGRSSGGTQKFKVDGAGTVTASGNLSVSGTGNVTGALTENSTRVFSRNSSYVSSDTAITANSKHEFTHGLGAVPALIKVYAVCTSIDNGYAVGDCIDITSNASGSSQLVTTYADSTKVYVIINNGISATNPTSIPSAPAALTLTNWKLRVRAWY